MPENQVTSTPIVRPQSNITATPIATQPITPIFINQVPLEFIEYFNINVKAIDNRESAQLAEIYKLLKNDGKDLASMLLEIRNIERKLGEPKFDETRYGRVWSHIKINDRISHLTGKKQ